MVNIGPWPCKIRSGPPANGLGPDLFGSSPGRPSVRTGLALPVDSVLLLELGDPVIRRNSFNCIYSKPS
jgi:hypothetical protein